MFLLCSLFLLPTLVFASGSEEQRDDVFRVGVFVPAGAVEGSPTYEMLVEGATRAVEDLETAEIKVVEGGFNQALWEEGLAGMAAGGEYDLLVTSNPSMPALAAAVAERFPGQRFLVMDGYLEGNRQIHTVLYNQREQAFLVGYFAGLVTTGNMEFSNPDLRVGLLAGQEYPIMNDVILPSFQMGARSINKNIEVDFRVLGNWNDAAKAGELATSMIDRGVDVILTIAGTGNQGVVGAARSRGAYVLWFDSAGYALAPRFIIGSAVVRQDQATYERVASAIRGELAFGEAEILGVREGFVDFADEDPLYELHVPQSIRNEMADLVARMQSGELHLDMELSF